MSSSARTFGHRVVKLAPGAGLGIILLFFQLFQDHIIQEVSAQYLFSISILIFDNLHP